MATRSDLILANLLPEELESVLARVEFKRYTERTITNPAKLTQALRQIRRDGYSIRSDFGQSSARRTRIGSCSRRVQALHRTHDHKSRQTHASPAANSPRWLLDQI